MNKLQKIVMTVNKIYFKYDDEIIVGYGEITGHYDGYGVFTASLCHKDTKEFLSKQELSAVIDDAKKRIWQVN